MAELMLTRHELEHAELPMVCIYCGKQATRFTAMRFRDFSGTAGKVADCLDPITGIANVIFLLRDDEDVLLKAPVCDEHEHECRRRSRIYGSWLTLGMFIIVILLTHLFFPLLLPLNERSFWLLMLFWIGLALLLKIRTREAKSKDIKARIMPDWIVFDGVSEQFIQALARKR